MNNTLEKIVHQVFRAEPQHVRAKLYRELSAAMSEKSESVVSSAAVVDDTSARLVAEQASGEIRRLGLKPGVDGKLDEVQFRNATAHLWPERRMAIRGLLTQAGYLP